MGDERQPLASAFLAAGPGPDDQIKPQDAGQGDGHLLAKKSRDEECHGRGITPPGARTAPMHEADAGQQVEEQEHHVGEAVGPGHGLGLDRMEEEDQGRDECGRSSAEHEQDEPIDEQGVGQMEDDVGQMVGPGVEAGEPVVRGPDQPGQRPPQAVVHLLVGGGDSRGKELGDGGEGSDPLVVDDVDLVVVDEAVVHGVVPGEGPEQQETGRRRQEADFAGNWPSNFPRNPRSTNLNTHSSSRRDSWSPNSCRSRTARIPGWSGRCRTAR